MKQFADRDRQRSMELLGERIAEHVRQGNPLWCLQLWAPDGPYPMVNVDANTRIVYPPSPPSMLAVSSTVPEPNASPSPL